MPKKMTVGNMKVEQEGSKLTLEIKLDKPGSPSKSGKTKINYSTHGAVDLPGGEKCSINIYSK